MVVRLFALFLFALFTTAQAEPLLVSDAQIAIVKANAKVTRSLLKKCDAELGAPDHAVADFAPQPHYTAKGANPDDDQAKGFTGDIRMAYRAALCFRLSGEIQYAEHAQAIADVWATKMKSASNAQGRADVNFKISQLVVAASWVRDDWNADQFSKWLTTTIAPLSLSNEPNNRGNWGVLLDISIAAFTQNKVALKQAAERWSSLLEKEVAADGTLPLEICRSNSSDHCGGADKGVNGLAYTHYALLPAALGAEILGYTKNIKLGSAFHKAASFTANPSSFPFYASNNGKLNKLDHCGYFALMQKHFADENARSVLAAGTCKSDIWMLQKIYPVK